VIWDRRISGERRGNYMEKGGGRSRLFGGLFDAGQV